MPLGIVQGTGNKVVNKIDKVPLDNIYILEINSNKARVPFGIYRAIIYPIKFCDAIVSYDKKSEKEAPQVSLYPSCCPLFSCFMPSTYAIVYSALSHAFIYQVFLSTWAI